MWNNLGVAYHYLKNYTKAIECYEKAITVDSNYVNAWNNLGAAYYYNGDLPQALQSFRKCLEFEPNNETASNWCKHIE